MCPLLPTREPWLCYVTDRKSLASSPEAACARLLKKIEQAAQAGVDWTQLREKDLNEADCTALAKAAVKVAGAACRVLINDSTDVAVGSRAGGVHLGERSLPVEEVKRLLLSRDAERDFLLGVSTHSLAGAIAAEKSGADYVIFGPVYETPSKLPFGPPQGIERLREVCRQVTIPVLAIGGITIQNVRECSAAGARGIAAIRLFQEAEDISVVVQKLREQQ